MKKMKTVFFINYDGQTSFIENKVRPENSWVINGEGVATIKFDGSSCLIKDGVLYKRWDRKLSKKAFLNKSKAKKKGETFLATEDMFKPLKDGAIACNETFDPITHHWPHWLPVKDLNEDVYHLEGLSNLNELSDGTYELVGPKVQGNPYNLERHELWKHGSKKVEIIDFSFENLKSVISNLNEEGLVFHHPDGRMAKLRRSDFNLDWN